MKPGKVRKCLTDGRRRQLRVQPLEDRCMLSLPGDMDFDFDVDYDDTDAFVLSLINAEQYERQFTADPVSRGDINGDGALNGLDVAPFVDLLTAASNALVSSRRDDQRQVIRIGLQYLQENRATLSAVLRAAADPEAVDADGYAVFFLTPAEVGELSAEGVPMQRRGKLTDYLAQFAPVKTLARKPLGSLDAVRQTLNIAAPVTAAGATAAPAAGAIGTSLQPYDSYHTLAEGVAFMQSLAAAAPDIAQMISIGQSVEGRDIWALKITDHPALDEPDEEKILFTGVTHAREWITHEAVLYIAECLVSRYDSDPQVQHIVDHSVVWLVPVVNPDGYEFTWTDDRMWRKNRRPPYGVDINRNFDYLWGYDDWGSSPDPEAQTYRGPAPSSEPETQAIQTLLAQQKFAIAVSHHSYSQLLLYPWGYTGEVLPESYSAFRALSKKWVDEVHDVHGKIYRPGQGNYTLYGTNGDFDDYAYAVHGTLAFTPELRPASSGGGGFVLPEEEILPTCEENMAAAIWLMLNVASATDYEKPTGATIIESPLAGENFFSLPFTPVNQKPDLALGFPLVFADQLQNLLDDAAHQPPSWSTFDVEGQSGNFELLGSGRGYRLNLTEDPIFADWANQLMSVRVLPYVFEDAAEVSFSNYAPGRNIIGVPTRDPVRMEDIRIIKRGITSVGFLLNYGETIFAERTALEDMNAADPWIDWTWEYVDSAGNAHFSHPTGAGGASETVLPFRAYYVNVNVPSYRFGTRKEQEAVYTLVFPGSIAFDYPDCNYNTIEDAADVAAGSSFDCNNNDIPDECELSGDHGADCNKNNIPDDCDIASGTSADCSGDGVPDECDPDCQENGVPDSCDIFLGTSEDCAANKIPDECEADCNHNGTADSCDILQGESADCDLDNTPDECQPHLFVPLRILVSGIVSDEFVHYLEEKGHIVRVLDYEEALPDNLDAYHVLVLAAHSVGDDPADEQAIDQFVFSGKGLVVVEGVKTRYRGVANLLLDRAGWELRENTVWVNTDDHPLTYELPPTSTLTGYSTVAVLKPEADRLIDWEDGSVMAATYQVGAGRSVYINDLWACYGKNWYGDPAYGMQLMANALAWSAPQMPYDCNANGQHDACDIANRLSQDVNANGIPDTCELMGDLDCDAHVGDLDIVPFVLAILSPEAYQRTYPFCDLGHADLNNDGTVNGLDVDPFVEQMLGR